jgi:nucleolin
LLILYRCTRNFDFNARKVSVSNLPWGMDHLDLQDLCSEFGAVEVGPRHT